MSLQADPTAAPASSSRSSSLAPPTTSTTTRPGTQDRRFSSSSRRSQHTRFTTTTSGAASSPSPTAPWLRRSNTSSTSSLRASAVVGVHQSPVQGQVQAPVNPGGGGALGATTVFAEPEAERASLVDRRSAGRTTTASSVASSSAGSASSSSLGTRSSTSLSVPPSVDDRPLLVNESAISSPSTSTSTTQAQGKTVSPTSPSPASSSPPSSANTTSTSKSAAPTAIATLKHAQPTRRSSGWFASFGRKTTVTGPLAPPASTSVGSTISGGSVTPKAREHTTTRKGKERAPPPPRVDIRDMFNESPRDEEGLPPVLTITDEFPGLSPVGGGAGVGGSLSLSPNVASAPAAAEEEDPMASSVLTIKPPNKVSAALGVPPTATTSAFAPSPSPAPAPAPTVTSPAPAPTHSISSMTSSSAVGAPATTTTSSTIPTPTSTAAVGPVSTSTTPLPSPRKRSWFYRSSAKEPTGGSSGSTTTPTATSATTTAATATTATTTNTAATTAAVTTRTATTAAATTAAATKADTKAKDTRDSTIAPVPVPVPALAAGLGLGVVPAVAGAVGLSGLGAVGEGPPGAVAEESESERERELGGRVEVVVKPNENENVQPVDASPSRVEATARVPATPPPSSSSLGGGGGSRFLLGLPLLGRSKKVNPPPSVVGAQEEEDGKEKEKGTGSSDSVVGAVDQTHSKKPDTKTDVITENSTLGSQSTSSSTPTSKAPAPSSSSTSPSTSTTNAGTGAQVDPRSSRNSDEAAVAAAANVSTAHTSHPSFSPLNARTNSNSSAPADGKVTTSSPESERGSVSNADAAKLGADQAKGSQGTEGDEASITGGGIEAGTRPEDPHPSEAGVGTSNSSWWSYVGWSSGQTPAATAGRDGAPASGAQGQSAAVVDDNGTAPEGRHNKTSGVGSTATTTFTANVSTFSTPSTSTIGPSKTEALDKVGTNNALNMTKSTASRTSKSAPDGNRGTVDNGQLGGEKGDGNNKVLDGNGNEKKGVFGAGNSGDPAEHATAPGAPSEVGAGGDGSGAAPTEDRGDDANAQNAVERKQGESGAGDPDAGSWYSPWAWYYGSSTTTSSETRHLENGQATASTTTTTTTIAAVEGSDSQAERVVEALAEESVVSGAKVQGGRDMAQVVSGSNVDDAQVHLRGKQGDSDPSSEEDSSVNPTTVSDSDAKGQNEPANPIEASFKANRSGWASFFNSQSLLVKAIGYRSTTPTIESRPVKKDENGMEIMDIDEDSDAEDAPHSEAETENGGESRSRSLVPKLLTFPVSSTTSAGENSLSSVKSSPPATPLTKDEDLKRKVAQSLPGEKRSKSTSGSSTPQPPPSPASSTGSAPAPSTTGGKPQPPLAEKSKSAPVTPKRGASPAPSTTKKSNSTSAAPNLVLPTWADTFHAPPRNVVLKSPTVAPPASSEESPDTGVGTRLFGKTMKFVSGVLWSKGEAGGDQGQESAHGRDRVDSVRGQRPRVSMKPPHPLRRSSSGTGASSLDITTLIEQERQVRFEKFGQELPKSWDVIEGGSSSAESPSRLLDDSGRLLGTLVGDALGEVSLERQSADSVVIKDVLRGCRRVVIIGVHGWFPGAMMRTVLGEPTGTSSKFANMMAQAIEEFQSEHGASLEKVTKIPLEGEGTIERRVEKLYNSLVSNKEWMDDLRNADVLFVATHSQGSVVSTHLLDRLIQEKLIYTRPEDASFSTADSFPSGIDISIPSGRKLQRVCCLALCGIHLGPLRYLSSSSLVAPYIQYFESAAARELFEFQDTESAVSKAYVKALHNVLDHGVKMVYIASLNDQVVPIYSGIFTAASHSLILRALYIDGDAYHSSDFLSNLLVLLLRLRNCGIPDGGLLAHLSEATAGSLSGVGHSTAYEDLSTYSLAVRYLFLTNNGTEEHPPLVIEPFNAAHEQNDYEIPWSLRDVIADERVIYFFSNEVARLRDAFRDWHPKTTILRDLKRKLQPIQRLPSSFSSGFYSTPKL